MSRAIAIQQAEYPYNIGARCINRDWFQISLSEVWLIFAKELARLNIELDFRIYSFVLMSNHFHLIASTPNANISQCMHLLMSRTSHQLTRAGNRINQTYGGRHFKCILHDQSYFLCAYKYNYRNPVSAGLCEKVEDYPFSTISYLTKNLKLEFAVEADSIFTDDPNGTLEWLNTSPSPEKLEGVRYALKRPYFKSKKHRKTKAPLLPTGEII